MYTPIVGTLGYVVQDNHVLLIHRNARLEDDHLGKYNGLGGKMESNEDLATCMKREIYEEAGIECIDMHLRGTINWTGFGKNGEDWLGFIFLITSFTGEVYENNPEGDLHWIPLDNLYDYPMWDGDKHFLPMIFDKDPRQFHGYMPYANGIPTDWSYVRL